MSDFIYAWELSRGRLLDAISGLNHAQLNWCMHPGALTIAQMVVHVAGVEMYFASQLTGASLSDLDQRTAAAAVQGVVNDEPFPFSEAELTPEFVVSAMARSRAMVEPLMKDTTPAIRSNEIKSALGPIVDGNGALARLSFHPGYHQGQVHLIVTSPGFPQ